MVVKITPRFTEAQIKKFIEEKLQGIHAAVLSRFKRVGETFVNNARRNGTYGDVTGNLRSSIGYIILKDGVQIVSGFPGAKTDGRSTAQRAASELARSHPSGYALIVVAGMDYAAAVESRGKDVLTGSSLLAKQQLNKAIQTIERKL